VEDEGSSFILHIQRRYEKSRRTRKELLLCKEQQKTSVIRKTKDHDMETYIKNIKE
jgi:hypothetical protein